MPIRYLLFGLAVSVACLLPSTNASTIIQSQSGEIVVDGDYLRIRGADNQIQIGDNWRHSQATSEPPFDRLNPVEQDGSLALAMAGDVLFAFDSAELDHSATAELNALAELIRQRARGQVLVVGHSDGMGRHEYNLSLSQRRAMAVADWLIGRQGIPAELFLVRGMGPLKPVAAENRADGSDNPAGRAQNRRVEILLATRDDVDLRHQAETTAISIDGQTRQVRIGSAVQISEHGVRIGDGAVDISAEGVRIGSLEIATGGPRPSSRGSMLHCQPGQPCQCEARQTCTLSCAEGGCEMIAAARSTVLFECPGGDCQTVCGPRAECETWCPGGNCNIRCEARSTCQNECPGNSCQVHCANRASCF